MNSLATASSSPIATTRTMSGNPLFWDKTIVLVLKEAMAQDLSDCAQRGVSRDHIADEMTRIGGKRVSRNRIDNWVAATKTERIIPATQISAWATATGSARIPTLLCHQIGKVPIPAEDQQIVDFIHLARLVFTAQPASHAFARATA